MAAKKPTSRRVAVTGAGWKKALSIDAGKYDQVARAILASLGPEPIRFGRLAELVAERLPRFDGSIAWYTISVARQLETEGRIVRKARPVLYSKPGARSNSARTRAPGAKG